jgi:hypothetical protein
VNPDLTQNLSATVTNTTLDDHAPEVRFTGDWTQQTGPNFHDQTSTYTGSAGSYFEVDFAGKLKRSGQ